MDSDFEYAEVEIERLLENLIDAVGDEAVVTELAKALQRLTEDYPRLRDLVEAYLD